MDNAKFKWGDKVGVLADIRNDGTFPGKADDELIVNAGEQGVIRQVGQVEKDKSYIYIVEFGERLIGCFEDELKIIAE